MNPFWIKQRNFFFFLFLFSGPSLRIFCAMPNTWVQDFPAFRGVNTEDGLKSKINFQLFALHPKTDFQIPFFLLMCSCWIITITFKAVPSHFDQAYHLQCLLSPSVFVAPAPLAFFECVSHASPRRRLPSLILLSRMHFPSTPCITSRRYLLREAFFKLESPTATFIHTALLSSLHSMDHYLVLLWFI